MANKRDHSFRYRAPIERRPVPQVPMAKRPWLLDGKAAPVRVFTAEERAAYEAVNPPPPSLPARPRRRA